MPKDELHECQCDFQPVNGNEILPLSALITCFGKHQTDGVTISHVEGGVLMDSGDEKDENKTLSFYILGYNGYSSDGTLCFSVVADGKTTAYDVCLKEYEDDNCLYGVYYLIDINGDEPVSQFGGYARFIDPESNRPSDTRTMAKAIGNFWKNNRDIYKKTVGTMNENLQPNICRHDDKEEKMNAARSFFRTKLDEIPKHKKSKIPSCLTKSNG